MAISTTPDCLDPHLLDYLARLSEEYYIFLEFGIESCYNHILRRINRKHSFEETVKSIEMSHDRDLHTTGHLLFGLPGVSRDQMLKEAGIISSLPLNAIKFHQLQVIRGTALASLYEQDPGLFELFGESDYIDFIIQFLERLDPAIAVERLSSESPPKHRIAPNWGHMRSDMIQKKIESVMEQRGTWQGKKIIM